MTYTLGQYADDMDTYLKLKSSCVSTLFEIPESFRRMSGFTVYYDKTNVYRIGSIRNTQAKCYVKKNLHWTNDPINVLGVIVHDDEQVVMKDNYNPIIEKSKT